MAGGYLDALGGRRFTSGMGGYCENNGYATGGGFIRSLVPFTDCGVAFDNALPTTLDEGLSAVGCAADVVPAGGKVVDGAAAVIKRGENAADAGKAADKAIDAAKTGDNARPCPGTAWRR